jgi:hypothetical protein
MCLSDRMDGAESKPSGSLLLTLRAPLRAACGRLSRCARLTRGPMPASDWNRPVRSRTQGGVGPVAGLTVSHGDPIRLLFGIGAVIVYLWIWHDRESSEKILDHTLSNSCPISPVGQAHLDLRISGLLKSFFRWL